MQVLHFQGVPAVAWMPCLAEDLIAYVAELIMETCNYLRFCARIAVRPNYQTN